MQQKPQSVLTGERLEGLADLVRDLREGRQRPADYLNRLKERFARLEPQVRAFVPEEPDRFLRLHKEAEALEARFPSPQARPALFGVPVGVKDIIHVDGFPTRAGSKLPPEVLAGPEAEVVRLLRQAGALILGKSVTTEFAYFTPGPTRNPHDLGRTPGGSSSGSAAAVACGLAPLALGTQTIGSVIRPASFCGVLGFKPTYGRISLEGVIPFAQSLDHMGFFCRDLEGIGLAASILCKGWRDSGRDLPPVLGIPEGPYLQQASQEGIEHFRKLVGRLSQADFQVRPVEVMDDFEGIALRHNRLMASEAAAVHSDWFSRSPGLYSPRLSQLLQNGKGVPAEEQQSYREGRILLRESLQTAMRAHGISAWIAPSTVGAAPMGHDSTGDPIMNLPWTHAGLPALTLPSGTGPEGMPLGLQVSGPWMEDESLFGIARKIAEVL